MAARVEKTRCSNTLTDSGFWGMIRSTLRQKSRWWLPIAETKKEARRPYVGTNKRQKWEYLCNKCKKYFLEKEVEINHIIPAGSLKSGDDLKDFVERLFCEKENLECLCKVCHLEITLKERTKK